MERSWYSGRSVFRLQPVEGMVDLMLLAFSSLIWEATSGEYENGGPKLWQFRRLEWSGYRVGGNGVLDFLFSKIIALVFGCEMRKPWLDSHFRMRLIAFWRTLCPRCGFAVCRWMLRPRHVVRKQIGFGWVWNYTENFVYCYQEKGAAQGGAPRDPEYSEIYRCTWGKVPHCGYRVEHTLFVFWIQFTIK